MLKAKLEDGLYTLEGSTIVGYVNAYIVQLYDHDKSILWHAREIIGLEFYSAEFNDFYKVWIARHKTARHTPLKMKLSRV